MTNTLYSATHDIATALGISVDWYIPTTPPHQRSRHGNREGPTIWVMISAILLAIMRDEGFGLNVLSCLF